MPQTKRFNVSASQFLTDEDNRNATNSDKKKTEIN